MVYRVPDHVRPDPRPPLLVGRIGVDLLRRVLQDVPQRRHVGNGVPEFGQHEVGRRRVERAPEVLHQARPLPRTSTPRPRSPRTRTPDAPGRSRLHQRRDAGGRRAHRTRGSRSVNPPCPRPARNPAGRRRHGRRRRCQRAGIRRPCQRSPVPAREHRSRNRTASARRDATHRRRDGPSSRRGVIERPRRRRSRPGAAGCMPASARIPLASTCPSRRRPSERSWAAHFESASNRAQVSPAPGKGTRSADVRTTCSNSERIRDKGVHSFRSMVRWPQDMEESRATGEAPVAHRGDTPAMGRQTGRTGFDSLVRRAILVG